MTEECEYRSVIKFLLNLKKTNKEILEMVNEGFGATAPHRATIYRWIAEIKGGRTDVHDRKSPGRPNEIDHSEKGAKLESLIMENRRVSISELSFATNLDRRTTHNIIKELGFRKIASRFVARILTPEMKINRMECSQHNLNLLKRHGKIKFLEGLVTVDETSLSLYLPETKQESMEWCRSGDQVQLKMKSGLIHRREFNLTVFWCYSGVIFMNFLPKGQSVTGQKYAEFIREASDRCGNAKRWFLQDNAPVHTAQVANEALQSSCFNPISHPPYSPDIAPSDYYLFRHLKKYLRGKKFVSPQDLKDDVIEWFNTRGSDFYKQGIDELPIRWGKCVANHGGYIEKT